MKFMATFEMNRFFLSDELITSCNMRVSWLKAQTLQDFEVLTAVLPKNEIFWDVTVSFGK
jgi:hypothetical protein